MLFLLPELVSRCHGYCVSNFVARNYVESDMLSETTSDLDSRGING